MADRMDVLVNAIPPKKILMFDLCTNFGWIIGNFFTSPFVESSQNLQGIVRSKAFIACVIIAIVNPIIKQLLLFLSII